MDRAEIYRRLPAPARSAAATMRGLQLRLTRYDRHLDRLVHEALEREHWSASDWDTHIAQALQEALAAAATVPYYREIRQGTSPTSLDGLDSTPKDALRADPHRFWSAAASGRNAVDERTSGTSGTPLRLRFTREAVRLWFALNEARVRRWHGLSVSDRWAMFGGQVVVPVERTEPPFWVRNLSMHQLYISTHHLSRRNAPAMAAALCRFRPRYLLGYPSSMALLARFAIEDGLRLPEVSVVLSNAETLTSWQRELLEDAFGAPVRNTYGMAEAVAGGSECDHGTMHLWPEVGIVEVADGSGGVSAEPGRSGPLVLTGLLNPAMPLLRYEVGDRGRVPVPSDCGCGRTLPDLGAIEGRTTDLLVCPDGRHVFWINPVFNDLPVAEAQVHQHRVDDVEVRIVPSGDWGEAHSAVLVARLHERLGSAVRLRVTVVDEIPREPSGKLRSVISHLDPD